MTDMHELRDRLSPGAVVTDHEVIGSYCRDRADIVPSGTPRAVVRPRSVEDVSATLAWANQRSIPVVPWGAGTGLSGGANAIDGGITLSLEKLSAIREINVERQYAVVEAGVINADVGRAVAARGLFYPPDPGSFEISTIGGNLATNAGGMRCVKYGVTRDSALSLEVVLADGRVLNTGNGATKDVAGYDLTSLFVGSEGTLGVITSAMLKLRPALAMAPVTFVASFPDLEDVGAAVDAIRASGLVPSLLELLDNATINAIEDYRRMDLDRASAGLLIGQADGAAAEDQVTAMMEHCRQAGADLVVQATNAAESDTLLQARRLAGTAVMASGPTVIEDVGVPPGQLTNLLQEIHRISKDSGMPIATNGHAGDGNLHPILLLPDLTPSTVALALQVGEQICESARALGGTITGEHGIGMLKRTWLHQQLGETALDVHASIKAALDPANILNPGRSF